MNDGLLLRLYEVKTICFYLIGKPVAFFSVIRAHPYFSSSTSFFKHDANIP
ncbi:hypothetical protein PBAL39_11317 [Pedobacter sp. BAL39]|nr:hypothetical protein PBAL39_11317 [Pedobacter sp. BAL39]